MSINMEISQENCSLCKNPVDISQKVNTANTLGDSEVIERIEELNRGKIDESKKSTFVICDRCRNEVDITYKCVKRWQGLMRGQSTGDSPVLKDAKTQTKSPERIILVNHIPKKITRKDLEDVFVQYGIILRLYFSSEKTSLHDFARIVFMSEDEALRVMTAAKKKKLKCKDELLVVTRVSEDISPINVLPDAFLIKIFSLIDEIGDKVSIAGVCRRWMRLVADSWGGIEDFSNDGYGSEMTSYPGLRWIFKNCGAQLKTISLNVFYDSSSCVKLIREYCKNVENLKFQFFSDAKSTEYHPEVLSVIQQCKKLRRFGINYLDGDFDYHILEHLPEETLEIHLSCSWRHPNTRPSMDLSKFKSLKALDLFDFDIQEDTIKGLEDLVNLEYLRLCVTRIDREYKFMNSTSRVHRSNIHRMWNLSKLKYLQIPGCGIDDEILVRIAQQNVDLEYLDINDNEDITDRPFKYIARLPKLKILRMQYLTQVKGFDLSEMHTLEELDVTGCSSMADWPLMILIDKSPNLSQLFADGPATWRLLKNAEESLELGRANPDLRVSVDKRLEKKWSELTRYDKKKLCLDVKFRDSHMIPLGRHGWYGNIK